MRLAATADFVAKSLFRDEWIQTGGADEAAGIIADGGADLIVRFPLILGHRERDGDRAVDPEFVHGCDDPGSVVAAAAMAGRADVKMVLAIFYGWPMKFTVRPNILSTLQLTELPTSRSGINILRTAKSDSCGCPKRLLPRKLFFPSPNLPYLRRRMHSPSLISCSY